MYMNLKPNKYKRISFNTTTMTSLQAFIQALLSTAVFFQKIEFSYCLHENAFPTNFLELKHTLSIADKHLWIL